MDEPPPSPPPITLFLTSSMRLIEFSWCSGKHGPGSCSFLLRDDFALDLVVGGLGKDFLLYQVSLFRIRAAVNDLLRIFFANPRKSIELLFARGIDVQQVGLSGGLVRRFRALLSRGLGLRRL